MTKNEARAEARAREVHDHKVISRAKKLRCKDVKMNRTIVVERLNDEEDITRPM